MFLEDKYLYNTNSSFLDFEFESIGPKGIIKKVARFSEIGKNNLILALVTLMELLVKLVILP
jgi:hypothetical protein